jgi:hypothetical protein
MKSELEPPIAFLDIDGVMIPGTQVLIDVASCVKRLFPATTIAVINELCKMSGALIVFNTSHNSPHEYGPDEDIRESMIKAGVKPEYIHPTDHKTNYRNTSYHRMPLTRSEGILEWLDRHPKVEEHKLWVVFDDVDCADKDHMILVDPNAGLHLGHLNIALRKLGHGGELILI